ncbi:MAG TPA: diaminopimelate decarboxylase [Bacteroidia bacterium]|nr:diaminopimelate decarboxylase [Bacteroidia bacterium]
MKKKVYERPLIQRLNVGLMNKFGMKSDTGPFSHIDGQPVSDLLKTFGSPLFVISEKSIREIYRNAHRAFSNRYPNIQLAWSYKTNYLDAVCRIYHQEGSWAEVVSGFEFQKAQINGVPGEKIIFNGPDKSREDLELAVGANALIHIDHVDELNLLKQVCKAMKRKARVAIRVNMDTGIYPMWDRFGFNYENGEAWEVLRKISGLVEFSLQGLHCHIGTFMLSPGAYGIAASKLSELAIRVKKEFGIVLQYIDLGGGFASKNTLKGSYLQGEDLSPGFEQYAEAICSALLNAGFDKQELPLLVLETGRALIDEAAYLLGTVVSNKRLSDGRRATIMDFGVNILFTSFWYDHKISPAQEFGQHNEDTVLYGPLCMNIDMLREHISLPPLNAGDHVVVHCVGAYNMTQWMQFITLRPAVVLIDSAEKVHIIRKRENLESVSAGELVPGHLSQFKL